MWRRRAALGILGGWGLLSLVRLPRLVEAPGPPPGPELDSRLLNFWKSHIPPGEGFLFVAPGEFGTDTGVGQRLRYELYPRPYDDIRAAESESTIRLLMRDEGLRFIVVPDATQYPATSWLRQPRDWLARTDFDARRYVLEVVS